MTPLHFLYHVPKTGGQTVRDHLDSVLTRGEDFDFIGRWDRGDHYDFDALLESLAARPTGEVIAVGGHPLYRHHAALFPGRPLREVVFIREPAARVVSHYNFSTTMRLRNGRPVIPFDQYVAEYPANQMTNFLAKRLGIAQSQHLLNSVFAELSSFWLVGRTESLDQLAPRLFGDMGLEPVMPRRSNVSGLTIERHVTLDPDLVEQLRHHHPHDVMLHRAAARFEAAYLERHAGRSQPSVDQYS